MPRLLIHRDLHHYNSMFYPPDAEVPLEIPRYAFSFVRPSGPLAAFVTK